jgi:hypothetical protein
MADMVHITFIIEIIGNSSNYRHTLLHSDLSQAVYKSPSLALFGLGSKLSVVMTFSSQAVCN